MTEASRTIRLGAHWTATLAYEEGAKNPHHLRVVSDDPSAQGEFDHLSKWPDFPHAKGMLIAELRLFLSRLAMENRISRDMAADILQLELNAPAPTETGLVSDYSSWMTNAQPTHFPVARAS